MKALRQIDVTEVTAAVLPGYELKFYGSGGDSSNDSENSNPLSPLFSKQLVETSAAFVQPVVDCDDGNGDGDSTIVSSVAHGVLYTLSENDFAKVGRTEGVPFGYRWQQCHVYPYVGDGETTGLDAMNDPQLQPLEAYTLVPPQSSQRRRDEVPPSASYLGLIKEGAELWKFDRAYQEQLVKDGVSELVLQLAERASGIERTYKIRCEGR
ncbi:MAG: hypothetical protein SGARI_006681 [Bacillariaceae sp.]